MILVVGQHDDPHVAAVLLFLKARGQEYFVVDSFGNKSDGLRLELCSCGILDIKGHRFDPDQIKSVWWRQKPRFIIPSGSASELHDYYFLHREWNQVLDFIRRKLCTAFSINDQSAEQRASNKLVQLEHAERVGFEVPDTLISNNFEAVNEFVHRSAAAKYVFKTLTPYMAPSGMVTYTTILNDEILVEKGEAVATAPGIFQKFREKRFELRVTIVGNDLFAARINSKHSPEIEIDWRRDIFADIYSAFDLPSEVEGRFFELHRAFGLQFGAYDLIVDTEGRYVFLEVNPAGQWMWLEQQLGFPISERIGQLLIDGQS